MTLIVTGARTTIVQELTKLLPEGEDVLRLGADLNNLELSKLRASVPDNDINGTRRYLFASGLLRAKNIGDQTGKEIVESLAVNLISIVQLCEYILQTQSDARICVVGSESGIRGSFDTTYALAKAALHSYIQWRKISENQQLVCIIPGMVADSGMTTRRKDQNQVGIRARNHPRGRLLMAKEVAQAIYWLLYVDKGYISNSIIDMTGKPK